MEQRILMGYSHLLAKSCATVPAADEINTISGCVKLALKPKIFSLKPHVVVCQPQKEARYLDIVPVCESPVVSV